MSGQLKEIVQYRAEFPDVKEIIQKIFPILHCLDAANITILPVYDTSWVYALCSATL